MRRSLMATTAGIINTVRYLWGAQESPDARYGTFSVGSLQALPEVRVSGELVDDLLRRRCLRCHLYTRGAQRRGDYRASGCAACHMPYADDGMSRSADQALRRLMDRVREGSRTLNRGYPKRHSFTTQVPTSQCLRCHNGNRVGLDFVGKFERDEDENYRFLSLDGRTGSFIYGLDQHRLLPDIHFERGLECIDCHTQREVMGDGSVRGRSWDQLEVRCADCHGTPWDLPQAHRLPEGAPQWRVIEANPRLKKGKGRTFLRTEAGGWLLNVVWEKDEAFLISKVSGKRHKIPLLARQPKVPVAHRIRAHMERMECHSCHAAWTFQDYGLHVLREDVARYSRWSHLASQNDPQVQRLLAQQLSRPPAQWDPPGMRDWLTGRWSLGVWYRGWTYRRWEGRILGVDSRGKVSCFRPEGQFVVSHVGRGGTVLLDSWIPRTRQGRRGWAFNPYVPHTQRRVTASCEECHGPGAVRTLGLGPALLWGGKEDEAERLLPITRPHLDGIPMEGAWEQMVRVDGRVLQASTHPGARPFNAVELGGLLHLSEAYKGWRIMDLEERGFYRLFRERSGVPADSERLPSPKFQGGSEKP